MDKYSFDRFIKQKNQVNKKKIIRLVLSFLLLSAVSYLFLEIGFFKNNTTAYYIFIGILATVTAYLNDYFKAPKAELNGYFEGKITFTKNDITIGNDVYTLDEIRSILIQNNDFAGNKMMEHGEFESGNISFGVNNQLILGLGKRKFVEAEFKQNTKNEFEKMKDILIEYHLQNKLSFEDLIFIMKIEYDVDKNELKKEISKRS